MQLEIVGGLAEVVATLPLVRSTNATQSTALITSPGCSTLAAELPEKTCSTCTAQLSTAEISTPKKPGAFDEAGIFAALTVL
jgi:hypothetical protein